jgi:hypothetical protein
MIWIGPKIELALEKESFELVRVGATEGVW